MSTDPDKQTPHATAVPQVPLYDKGSREEEAEQSLKRTVVGRTLAWVLCLAFTLTVCSELIVQHFIHIRRHLAAEPSGTDSRGAEHRGPLPQAYHVVDLLPSLERVRAARSFRDYWNLLPPEERIREFDTSLEESSAISAYVMPRTQELFTGLGKVGNEKAYCGQGPWLFYRPEIDYLTGRGFLEPAVLRQRSHSARGLQPDPRVAIIDFAGQLKTRGIALIVMPVPSKPIVHPEHFTDRFDATSGPLQNPSYERFRQDLEVAGVPVFDETDAMVAAKRSRGDQFLETDTHWRPETMEAAAQCLADLVRERVGLAASEADNAAFMRHEAQAENLGDIAVMLNLPTDQHIYASQQVTIHPVLSAEGKAWRPSATAEVLLLGDSYTNIYSVGAMGWGESAGLAEQLSFALQRPVDRISRNDSGAYATRESLRNDQTRGTDRLVGKKVVIWEFAMRELFEGDWKLIELASAAPPVAPPTTPLESPSPGKFLELAPGKAVLVTGTVAAASTPPVTNSVYKHYLTQFHLMNLRGADGNSLDGDQAVVLLMTMKDRKILPPALWKPGQEVTLRLSPWSDAAGKYDALRRSELDGDFFLEPLCFGEYQP